MEINMLLCPNEIAGSLFKCVLFTQIADIYTQIFFCFYNPVGQSGSLKCVQSLYSLSKYDIINPTNISEHIRKNSKRLKLQYQVG